MAPNYTSVVHHANKVAIVGTGSSIKEIRLLFPDDVKVMAVNSAIYYQKPIDFWFTLDPSPSNIEIMKTRFFGVAYYAAVPETFKPVSEHILYLKRATGDGHGRYLTKGGLSRDKRVINTGNSAAGALQLAVLMGAKHIGLFGLDGYGDYHYGGKPRNLTMMPDLFESYVDELRELGVAVVNGSPLSTIKCFPKMTPEETVSWLKEQQ